MPTNPFVWFDNMGPKSKDTTEFLSKNFGWDIQQFGPLSVLVDGENGPFADAVDISHEMSGWVPYVEVDNLEKEAQKACENGASIIAENIDGPAGIATFIRDPGGAPLAIWKRHDKAS